MTNLAIRTGSSFDRTPHLRGAREIASPDASWQDVTPMSVKHTSPDLGSIIRSFSDALDLVEDRKIIRVVVNPMTRAIISSSIARSALPLDILQFGRTAIAAPGLAPDVVSVFSRLKLELGVTQDDMFAATGIKHRTFHSWKRKSVSSRPRLESVGRLWELDDVVNELREGLDTPVGRWLQADPKRLTLFRAGKLDDLLELASGMVTGRRPDSTVGYVTGVGVDTELPIVRSGRRQVSRVINRINK
jgi:hypothetical protein